MPVTAVVGAQWGDEGKGRIVDYLAQHADLIIRYQGGDNAGHTVVNEFGRFALHMVPSGVFNPVARCVVGAGCVVNPDNLLAELAQIEAAGVPTSNLVLSERAHVVMPYHPRIDGLQERSRSGREVIGTTLRGIGPTYADKAARWGIRLGDLLRPDWFRARLANVLPHKNREIADLGGEPFTEDELIARADVWRARIGHRIVDTTELVQQAVKADRHVLLEGQLGVMRDIDWGTWPYVTSSNPLSGHAAVGAGLPPQAIRNVIGVVKAYSTAVGAGPFPVELTDEVGEQLRTIGHEYGATTGRSRRCGWFDAVALRYAAWLNGFTSLAITKLDVLDTFEEIKVCIGYRYRGEVLTTVPDTPVYDECEPIYETWPGWRESTREVRSWDDLPKPARLYLRRLAQLVGVKIEFISVGAEREELIVM
ncbi:MAG TPA: adenylosuccinate synthase [Myxococcota bacterium]|nr:adenylosuccinate synthase [Myxococcota bacterium]